MFFAQGVCLLGYKRHNCVTTFPPVGDWGDVLRDVVVRLNRELIFVEARLEETGRPRDGAK